MSQGSNTSLTERTLSAAEARALLLEAVREPIDEPRLADILVTLNSRGVTPHELEGFAEALLDLSTPVDLDGVETIDLCGTGGDGKSSFNISTTTAFILAGAGYKVAKHGNYGVSSPCGSSNVLEALGISFASTSDHLKRDLESNNICFIHAPLFHPAMKRVAPIRRSLGTRTIFNMLGPLVNPARPAVQVNGVYDATLLPLYRHILSRRGTRFATILSDDGYDELTLTGPVTVSTAHGEERLTPHDFDLPTIAQNDLLAADSVEGNARLLTRILRGEGTPAQEAVVVANAALAMMIAEQSNDLRQHVERAKESLYSKRALEALTRSVERP